ncbi:MAG TPA: lysophospholipid acyltransferase family protein [Stellaceae bacterium]|nr:lysophospholipid acyltransferase family protein [Stellaceae bacterium]
MLSLKRWRRSPFRLGLASWLIAAYAKLVWVTGRWTFEGSEHVRRFDDEGGPLLAAFWHGRILVIPFTRPRHIKFHIVISAHDDGRAIAGAIRYFGVDWIAGSSTEGGSAALRAMLRHLKAGDGVGITPDGPDGPAMRAKPGIVAAARLAKVPVIPVTYATRWRCILGSWDRFHLPLPFSRGIVIYGPPIAIGEAGDPAALEAARLRVEQGLNAITAEADRRMGHEIVAPGTLNRAALRDLKRAGQRS